MKNIVKKLLVLLLATVVAFGIVEALTRLILPPPQDVIVRSVGDFNGDKHVRPKEGSTVYVRTSTGLRLRPNSHAVITNANGAKIDFKTNSLGYRNRELGDKTGPRILFLGDSITAEDRRPEEDTFVRLVETLSRQGGGNWETVNAGVGGASLQDELSILVETGVSTKPDAVVLGFYLNDFQSSPGVHISRLPWLLNKSVFLRHLAQAATIGLARFHFGRELVRNVDDNLTHELLKSWRDEFKETNAIADGDYHLDKSAFNSLIVRHFSDWGGAWSARTWELMDPMIEEFKRRAEAHGFKPYIIIFPVRYQVEAEFIYDYPQRRVEALSERLSIPILNMLPVLRTAYRKSDEKLFVDQCHYTSYGSKLVAKTVYDFLAKRF